MAGDLSIGEAVKLRRRSSTANSLLKEIAAADERAIRLRRKLEKKRKKKARFAQTSQHSQHSGDSGKISVEEVSLSTSAVTAFQSAHILHREFSLPPSFTSLKLRERDQTSGPTLGASQLVDLINEDCSPVRPERPGSQTERGQLVFYENKSTREKILGKVRDFQLSLWTKAGSENFQNIFEAKLDRKLLDPILVCSGDTFTIREFFVEEDKVKIFRFSVLGGGVKPSVTSSETSVLITETRDIQDLHCLKVDDERTVIAYNISGRSRVHLFTTVADTTEVKFLGNVETEVRNVCLLHGPEPDKMFIYLCDSRLIIWNLKDGKCISKPIFFLPTRILGAALIKTKLCFIVHDGKEVKLSIFENQRCKDLIVFQLSDASASDANVENLSLLSVEQDYLTFLAGLRVLRLNLNTSEMVCETLF